VSNNDDYMPVIPVTDPPQVSPNNEGRDNENVSGTRDNTSGIDPPNDTPENSDQEDSYEVQSSRTGANSHSRINSGADGT
jgi:hypothetical protein